MWKAQTLTDELVADSKEAFALKQECDSLLEQIGGIESQKNAAQTFSQNAETAAQRAEEAAEQVTGFGTICDALDSDASDAALSARQGSVLRRYAVELRFRDRMIPDPCLRCRVSSYPNLVAHCAIQSTAFFLLSNQSEEQIIVSVNRATGAVKSQSNVLTQNYTCMTYDSYIDALLLGGAQGVTVMLSDYEIISQRALGAVTGITAIPGSNQWILYSDGELIWIAAERTEQKRMQLPQGIREPQSIFCYDDIVYLMTPVTEAENAAASGVACLTAMDETGAVLKNWILPRGYGTLCSVTAEENQMLLGYDTERGAILCRGDYRDTVDTSGQLGAARAAEECSVSGYSEDAVQLYVDAAYIGVSDGTQNRPFSSIKDALDCAHKWKACKKITLQTTGDFTAEGEICFSGFSGKLEVLDDETASTKIQCESVVGCAAVRFQGISCLGLTANRSMVDIDQSNVILDGCVLNLLSGSGTRYAIRAVDSHVSLTSLNTFRNVTTGIYATRSQILLSAAQSFTSVSTQIALTDLSEARMTDRTLFQILCTNSFVYSVN